MKYITLCCNAGMSTSLLVQKMQKVAQERGLDVEIHAYPITEIMSHMDQADVILLGPQISYALDDYKKQTDKPIAVIPMMDYGRMNASKIIDDALKLMGA